MRVAASFLTFRLQGFSMRKSAPYVNKIASLKKKSQQASEKVAQAVDTPARIRDGKAVYFFLSLVRCTP